MGDSLVSGDVARAMDEIEAALSPAGVRLSVTSREVAKWRLELLIDESACAECVLPTEHIAEIVRFKLHEADPRITEVELIDRRG